jgi:glycosyltransferase involved in cell wall biosynthesis
MPQNEPVAVAYVLPGLARGGTEKHVRDLVAGIDRRKFSPRVISTGGGGPMEEEFSRLGVPVHVLEYRGISLDPRKAGPLFRDARSFFRDFDAILAASGVRILHCYLPAANVLGMAAALLARTPVKIVSKRALCRYKQGHPVYSFFENMANLAADAVLANSKAVAEDVLRHERFVGGKIGAIPNGIDPDLPPSEPIQRLVPGWSSDAGDAVVTYVANFFKYKGHRDLVAAAALVIEAMPAVRFLLVGRDAGEMESLRRQVTSLGLERNFFFAGERAEAARIIASSTLVVHPSHEEGFSNTVLEAMAAGKAIVATSVGGIPEAVVDGETGLLVPPHDPPALADALLSLLRNPSRAEEMGKAAKRRVRDDFSAGKMVSALEQAYMELLDGRPMSCRV